MWEVGGSLKAIFVNQVEVITLVKDLAADTRIQMAEGPYLAIFLGDELLAHRGDLDKEVVFRKIEIGSEVLVGTTLSIP